MLVSTAPKDQPIWSRQYLLIIMVNFFFFLADCMLLSLLPLYALHVGGSNAQAGLMTGIFTFAALLCRPLFGRLLDKKGRRAVLWLGLILMFLGALSFAFLSTIGVLLVFRFINGIGFSAGTTAITTVVSDILPVSRLTEGLGYFGISSTLAQALGPFIGLYIINYYSYQILFLIISVMALASLICALFIKYRKPDNQKIQSLELENPPETGLKSSDFYIGVLIIPALVMLLASTASGGIQTFVAKYALSIGIKDIGAFFTVFAISTMLSRIMSGRLVYFLGLRGVIIPAVSAVLISQLTLTAATGLWSFLIAAIFYGLGLGCLLPSFNSIFVLLTPPKYKGTAIAVYYCAIDIGIGVGSVIWGLVSQAYGFSTIYLLSAGCCLIALILYYFVLYKSLQFRENVMLSQK